MLTQHTPRVPHRPTLPHGTAAITTLIVLALVLVVGIFMTFQAMRPVPTTVEAPKPVVSVPISQAAVGQHTIVTGMIFDGTSYRSAPVAVAAGVPPTIGQHTIVTAMIFDGTTYRSAPITIGEPNAIYPNGAPMRHLTGSVYEPSQVEVPKVTYSTGAPMRHLTGSVYEPR